MRRRATAVTITVGAALAGLTVATVSGNAAAVTAAHHAAAPKAAAHPAYGTIVVSDNGSIREFAPGAHGNVAPIRVIKGAATTLTDSYPVELDGSGNIWAAEFNNNTLLEFAAMANGNVAPLRTISTPSAGDLSDPDGLALVPGENRIWVGNDTSSVITKFATTANGSVSPAQRIVGSNTGITFSHDLALSPDGRHLWEADGGTRTLREFTTTGVDNRAPVRTISVGAENVHYPEGIAVDAAGNVWTGDYDANALYEYGPGSDTVPIRAITGANTGIAFPDYISIDPAGKLWVAVGGQDPIPPSVEQFSPTANGNVAPLQRLAGPNTGLDFPQSVDVYGAKPGAPRSVTAHGGKHKVAVHWRTPASTGGGLQAYVVRRKTSKHAAWTLATITKSRHFTDRHRKAHHRYRYDVIAVNARGSSAASKTASAVTGGKRHK
jgi:sugar lactone lactonase YvrE